MNVLLVRSDIEGLSLYEKDIPKWGYHLCLADNAQQAYEHIRTNDCDIVLYDWLMSETNAIAFGQQVRALNTNRRLYIILVRTPETHPEFDRAGQSPMDDYMAAPLHAGELRARLEIGSRIVKLERELNQKYLAIKRNYYQSIHMFTQMLETYHKDLGGHSRRVGRIALILAQKHPGIPPEDYPVVEAAGLLHDIGLVGLPESLVTKSIPEMNGDEKNGYYAHSERGELILNHVDLLRPVAKIVRLHHEQYNGRGFPDGLCAKQIPVAAAAVGAASVYDHLVHHKKIALDDIPAQLQLFRGYQFSSEIIDLLIEINFDQMQEEAQRTFRTVDIEELQTGMILADDIHMRTGAFVMASDTCIDASAIEKLKRYREIGNISSHIFVKK
jgi:cyclic di-GMP phosphodiesterase